MAPLWQELSSLEVETLDIVEHEPSREGFYIPQQDSSLDTLTSRPDVVDVDARTSPVNIDGNCCCCSVPCCACCLA